jgi:hypothetical protein
VIGRKLCGLEGAADGVVVGDGDRAEADCLGMHDEVCWIDGAVVRPARVHVEVAEIQSRSASGSAAARGP